MLSDHERRTLEQIESDLAESDPEFARYLAVGETRATPRAVRRNYVIWFIAATAALLTIMSAATGLTSGAILCATLVLGALVCQLWWPHPGLSHQRRRNG